MKFQHVITALAFGLLAACQQQPAGPEAPERPARESREAREPLPIPANCPVLAHRNWEAALGTEATPNLTVSGEIDLPTPGYSVSLARSETDSTNPAATSLTLTLTAPTTPVAQAVTPTPVRYFAPAPADIRRVRIVCGDGALKSVRVKQPE